MDGGSYPETTPASKAALGSRPLDITRADPGGRLMPTHRLWCTKCSRNSEASRQHREDSLGKELCDDWLQPTPHNLLTS